MQSKASTSLNKANSNQNGNSPDRHSNSTAVPESTNAESIGNNGINDSHLRGIESGDNQEASRNRQESAGDSTMPNEVTVIINPQASNECIVQQQHQTRANPPTDSLPPPPYSAIPVPIAFGRSTGPPPSYDEVINPDAAPPSYSSLFGQVREARKASNGVLDFLRKVILLLLGTLGCTIIIGFTIVIPLTMIVIGSTYMDECPAENIPLFLLVGGLVWVLKNLLNFWSQCRRQSRDDADLDGESQIQSRNYEALLNCFLLGWFISGCFLVYRIYEPDYENKAASNYCNRTVYLYAFWLVTSTFIIFGLFMACLCCLTVSSVVAEQSNSNE